MVDAIAFAFFVFGTLDTTPKWKAACRRKTPPASIKLSQTQQVRETQDTRQTSFIKLFQIS
jgi:hypothetical protein